MAAAKTKPGAPPGEARYRQLDRAMEQLDFGRTALLPALHAAQDAFGYLSAETLAYVSERLRAPLSQVYGAATFYHLFTFAPPGEHRCLVCTDPACAIAGGEEALAAMDAHGGALVERATCLGLCDQGPAALFDGQAYVGLRADEAENLFAGQAQRPRLQVAGEPRVLTRHIGALAPTDLAAHRAAGAFTALETALTELPPEEVIDAVKVSGLAGRGGAGFPTGLKWQFTRGAAGEPKYVVCNFDESEPGTFKDRALAQGDPFRAQRYSPAQRRRRKRQ